MKSIAKILVLGLSLSASTTLLNAQDGPRSGDDRRPPMREGGPRQFNRGGPNQPGQDGQRVPRLMNPVIKALDLNQDGVLDSEELDNAGKSLRTLDLNGDGKITRDEFRIQRPGGPDQERGPQNRRGNRPERRRGSGADRGERPLPPEEN